MLLEGTQFLGRRGCLSTPWITGEEKLYLRVPQTPRRALRERREKPDRERGRTCDEVRAVVSKRGVDDGNQKGGGFLQPAQESHYYYSMENAKVKIFFKKI